MMTCRPGTDHRLTWRTVIRYALFPVCVIWHRERSRSRCPSGSEGRGDPPRQRGWPNAREPSLAGPPRHEQKRRSDHAGRWLLFLLLLWPHSTWAQSVPSRILITGANVLDADGQRLLEGRHVLIEGDRIKKVAPATYIEDSEGVQTIDANNLTLLPGLIELHAHLLLHPYNEAPWNDQVLRESLEFRVVRAVAAAKATVESGFTTLRDLGTEGAAFADVGLRDATAKNIVPGPRIFASTKAIVATGCYGPSGFDPRWDVPKGAQVADGVDGVRRAVREQIAAGADWIKVYADYSRRDGDPPTATFSQEELNALVAEARNAGLSVAAHAYTDEAIRRSVFAGVATIEHGSRVSADVLTLMRERGVVLCPTLAAHEAMAKYDGWTPDLPDPPRIKDAKEMFKRALAAGVTIGCGSDVGVFPHGQSARELELMVEYGMRPVDAIRAATLVAATVLRRGDTLGKIADGYLADLIAVRENPLEDVTTLRNVVLVIKDGRVLLDRR